MTPNGASRNVDKHYIISFAAKTTNWRIVATNF